MLKKYNFIILGEWWFGTDIPDLLRTLLVNAKYNNKKNYEKYLNLYFANYIDNLQNIIDLNKLSSEVHIVIKKINGKINY